MAFLGLFRKSKETPPQAANDGIAYYENLIDELVAEHKQLAVLQDKIEQNYHKGQRRQLIKNIQDLRNLIQSHILKENLRLYAYLQQNLVHHEDSYHIFSDFRREMDQISRPILRFLGRFNEISDMSDTALAQFMLDLNNTLNSVHERMHREEAVLYPLYQASY